MNKQPRNESNKQKAKSLVIQNQSGIKIIRNEKTEKIK